VADWNITAIPIYGIIKMRIFLFTLIFSASISLAQTNSEMIELARVKAASCLVNVITWRVERFVPSSPQMLADMNVQCDAEEASLKKSDPSFSARTSDIKDRRKFYQTIFGKDRKELEIVKATFFSPTVWQVTKQFVTEDLNLMPGQEIRSFTARGDGLCISLNPKSGRATVTDNLPSVLDTILRGNPTLSVWRILSTTKESDISTKREGGSLIMTIAQHDSNFCTISFDSKTFVATNVEFYAQNQLVKKIEMNDSEAVSTLFHIDDSIGKTALDMKEKWTIIASDSRKMSKNDLINFRIPPDLLVNIATAKISLMDVPSEKLLSGQVDGNKANVDQ
jgi:hypothetical protein